MKPHIEPDRFQVDHPELGFVFEVGRTLDGRLILSNGWVEKQAGLTQLAIQAERFRPSKRS